MAMAMGATNPVMSSSLTTSGAPMAAGKGLGRLFHFQASREKTSQVSCSAWLPSLTNYWNKIGTVGWDEECIGVG